ncbi:hypothetical protein B0T10DRAFT_263319 [Thelonectria olida]|uniref:Translation initiation factor IF-3 n=1 Tax=Thelonectria olida TaxID=1576542 RepID=A0A9P8WAZ6_9HYPO|nr:hypothetical protein B0T10DRAFT_263319 [Thelonectria olida]
MNTIQCSNTSRRALYRVFVSPLERHEPALQRQLMPLVHNHSARSSSPSHPFHLHQVRSFIAQAPRLRSVRPTPEPPVVDDDERGFDRRYTTKEDIAKSGRDRYPQDHEITDPKVMVLDNGNISGPLPTRHVLSRLESSESLRMVNPYIPAKPKDGRLAEYALCKVVNKKEEYLRQREAKERKRVTKATTAKNKEVELNWSIGDNDLQTKMRQLIGFLEKGWRVEIVLGKKRGSRKVEDAEAQGVLDKVKKAIEEANGKQYREMDGQLNRSLRLYYEGKATNK